MSDPTEFNTGGPPGSNVPGWKPPPDLVGTVLADRYKVISVLGDGGMGRVYLGEHVTLRKKVAIKVLKQEFCHDRTNVERFLQEARAASMIRHENIVDIMDFGQVPGGSVFFVMELLEGADLSDLIKKIGRLPWMRTRNILLQVVRALRAAHESGIIHRDMKPANVYLIDRSGVNDYVKVLDFGIAKVDDQSTGLTRTGAVFGTAGYMAPEQACGDPVDSRTDVYAVGCMMFEMLTGRTPFPGTNFMRVLTQHMNEPPPRPREVCPEADVSDEVETIILTALAKKQEDRFRDMAALEKAIAQANGEVATVPPQNRPRTTNKGTVVLEDGPNPFAGMTPGQPPPGFTGGDHGGDGATMMLDGMGGQALGDHGGEGATMMIDGMGGQALGDHGGDGATMMLDGFHPTSGTGSHPKMTPTAPVTGSHPQMVPVTGEHPQMVRPEDEEAEDRRRKMIIIGTSAAGAVLLLVLVLILTLGGGDGDDEVADKDDAGEVAAGADGAAADGAAADGAAADGAAADGAAGAAAEADAGAAADAGAVAEADAGAADGAAADGEAPADDGAAPAE
ncbi:MAG: serine/threonine protein kinase, partial [Myxococcales bacterium]|nr:serine/threonine protein kinase [Myxococcales bacterium]